MPTTSEIRSTFLSYFENNGHAEVDSSPLVPLNDPTLLFTNAGMVQFKNVFTGDEARGYSRAVTSQKCVRAGGKHNDLDNVGFTARHHTFFEMLGNFSFGDYFKDGAIEHAWNLITRDFGLNKDKLLVTVYHDDDEAANLWKKVAGLTDDRIIRIATSDNFWSMGDTGPCGPCSEIFYDHGDHIPGGPPGSPDEDGDRFIEIWNLVFMQFEQQAGGNRIALPKPSIDTGMGLERLAAVLQGQHDNYDIDLMRNLIEASAHATNSDPDGPHKTSHRVIADHLRSMCFLIADGVLPSNEGRGYVLRRIMRRAMRHAHMIGVKDPLMYRLVPALIAEMGDHYSQLGRAKALITETLKLEEDRFTQTLERGLKLLDEEVEKLPGSGAVLPGEVAFKLYDTYGFPLDLTQDALRLKDIGVDTDGFDAAMQRQKEEARKNWSGSGDAGTEALWFDIQDTLGATEFLGYETERAEGRVDAIVVDAAQVDTASAGQEVRFVTNQTPFYGESGGQMGDHGVVTAAGLRVKITDTAKVLGSLHVHVGTIEEGTLKVGEAVELQVDGVRRAQLRANHSATHLLHEALRVQLGEHVTQKGSLVASDRLRFDIAQPKALTVDDVQAVEDAVNAQIVANTDVQTHLMTPGAAIEAGAMALFGEKYGEEVRVVSMGAQDDATYSTELCGGTHVRRTGDIGLFKIVQESAVAAGVRRIEALTGDAARSYFAKREQNLAQISDTLKTTADEAPARVAALLEERKKLERELSEAKKKLAMGGGGSGGGMQAVDINGVSYIGQVLDGVSAKDLRGLVDEAKKTVGSGVVALVAVNDGKAAVAVGVTDDKTGDLSAVDLVRVAAAAMGGKGGGGRPDMAQAGGPEADQAQAAVDAVAQALR